MGQSDSSLLCATVKQPISAGIDGSSWDFQLYIGVSIILFPSMFIWPFTSYYCRSTNQKMEFGFTNKSFSVFLNRESMMEIAQVIQMILTMQFWLWVMAQRVMKITGL